MKTTVVLICLILLISSFELVAQSVLITFEVDMSIQIDKGNFDAANGTLSLAGTMNGWDAHTTPMFDVDSDKVYSVTLNLNVGDFHYFKFVTNSSGWEYIPDRQYIVPDSADTFRAYFDDDDGIPITTEITISFSVNMELEIAYGRFNIDSTVTARGSFNGWSDVTPLSPSLTDPNIYNGSAKYDTFEGDIIYYKYAYTTENGTNWETNVPTNSGNYELIVTSDDIVNQNKIVPVRRYNATDIFPPYINETIIRFIVDMNEAVDTSGNPFPSIDNVIIVGGNPPLAWPSYGWPDSDSSLIIFLFDDGTKGDSIANDNFWTIEIVFPVYSSITIEYRYGANWGLPSNNGNNDNEAEIGNVHYLINSPYIYSGEVFDVFGKMGTQDVINNITQFENTIPINFNLEQNYPNPFNPSTVIRYSIPRSTELYSVSQTTLKIYDILGNEIATLVNEPQKAGFYEVKFDAQNLSSGIYFYRLQSGNFSQSKKMILVK